ncbi:MAG TPA: MATE family efflux transporter [Syntrophorhabdaceae bacterium]|nr:MATE family efflux transporter [Syntrophorhabdaceae bacterium]
MMSIRKKLNGDSLRRLVSESWSNSWPMILIMFFEFLIGITDIYIAGKIDKQVQAAYGFVIQLYFVFIIVANALSTGTVSVVSRLFTAGDEEALRDSVYSSVIASAVSGAALSLGGLFFTPLLIKLINIPEELKTFIIPMGRVYAAGVLFHYIVINTNAILRACKQVRSSLKTMSVVCAVNIALNFFIVFYTSLGYLGIALSTAIGVAVGCALNVWYTRKFISGAAKISLSYIKSILSIGWPFGMNQILWQSHSMVLYLILSMLPSNRIEILAAFSAGLRIESAVFLPAAACHMANAVIVGNLIGADKKETAFHAGIITSMMALGIVGILTLTVIASAKFIAPVLSNNPVVVAECVRYLYISMLSEPFMAFWMVLGGALSGAGDTKSIMIISTACTWFIRIPLCFLWIVILGFDASSVWWTMNLSQFLTTVFIVKRYSGKKWLEPQAKGHLLPEATLTRN